MIQENRPEQPVVDNRGMSQLTSEPMCRLRMGETESPKAVGWSVGLGAHSPRLIPNLRSILPVCIYSNFNPAASPRRDWRPKTVDTGNFFFCHIHQSVRLTFDLRGQKVRAELRGEGSNPEATA